MPASGGKAGVIPAATVEHMPPCEAKSDDMAPVLRFVLGNGCRVRFGFVQDGLSSRNVLDTLSQRHDQCQHRRRNIIAAPVGILERVRGVAQKVGNGQHRSWHRMSPAGQTVGLGIGSVEIDRSQVGGWQRLSRSAGLMFERKFFYILPDRLRLRRIFPPNASCHLADGAGNPAAEDDLARLVIKVEPERPARSILQACSEQATSISANSHPYSGAGPLADVDVPSLLSELSGADIVASFAASEKNFGAIRNFRKWQRPRWPMRNSGSRTRSTRN
jgi:hypothetical protein